MKTDRIRSLTITAVCVALCYVLPLAFHGLPIASSLSPMHIPVLLCGLICGGGWGLLCGIAGPVLSSLLSGMPPFAMLIRMIPELAVYGLVAGLSMKFIRTGKTLVDVYISLAIAMILGRIAGGVATAIFFAVTTQVYSLTLWVTSYFVNAVPGIVAHLVLVPLLALTLIKARVLPNRYSK